MEDPLYQLCNLALLFLITRLPKLLSRDKGFGHSEALIIFPTFFYLIDLTVLDYKFRLILSILTMYIRSINNCQCLFMKAAKESLVRKKSKIYVCGNITLCARDLSHVYEWP